MKKILVSILSFALTVCLLLGFSACGTNVSWEKPTLTDGGAVKSEGGFIAETEKYLYYINGVSNSSGDNTYGAPIKGSLCAVEKSSIGTDSIKTEVIVPKLFCANDFGAGVYIYDGYVYYGTPSTDKNSSGEIQSNEMAFMKTKLDGTEKPIKLFTISTIAAQYRIVKGGDSVYVVYYEAEDSSVKSYCESTGKITTIVKTDDKTNVGENVYLSLDTVKFADNDTISDSTVVYSVKVYNEKYFEEKAAKTDYTRATANYNLVYSYKAGEEPKLILDGSKNGETYTLLKVGMGNAFVCAVDQKGGDNCIAVNLADTSKTEKINSESNVADTTLFVSLEEIYTVDTEAGVIYKDTLIGDQIKQKVAYVSTVSTLIAKNGDYIYYFNSDSKLARIELNNVKAVEELVSADGVNTAWYKPQVITLSDKTYIFYIDTSLVGSSYVYFVDLSSKVIEKDNDSDGTTDVYQLEGQTLLGITTNEDKANIIKNEINNIEAVLKLTKKEDGSLYSESVDKAQKLYDEASKEIKSFVSEEHVIKLTNANKAVELANYYAKLEGVQKLKTAEEAVNYKTFYEDAKAYRTSLINYKNSDGDSYYTSIRDMLEENLKYYYQEASKLFEE